VWKRTQFRAERGAQPMAMRLGRAAGIRRSGLRSGL
jgi:hypothetical protein